MHTHHNTSPVTMLAEEEQVHTTNSNSTPLTHTRSVLYSRRCWQHSTTSSTSLKVLYKQPQIADKKQDKQEQQMLALSSQVDSLRKEVVVYRQQLEELEERLDVQLEISRSRLQTALMWQKKVRDASDCSHTDSFRLHRICISKMHANGSQLQWSRRPNWPKQTLQLGRRLCCHACNIT